MGKLFSLLFEYLKPIITFFVSIVTPLGIILGAIQNPEGAINVFLIKVIDMVHPVFPSTPENLKVSSIINSLGDSIPLIGKSIIFEILQSLSAIFLIVIVVKIYKLIPFKMT